MKYILTILALIPMLLAGIIGTHVVLASQAAALTPTPVFAAQYKDPCTLPDGNQGLIETDNRTCCPSSISLGSGSATSCLFAKYINPVVQLLSAVIGVIIVVGILAGAVEYITAGGDPQKVNNAKQRITNALIGLVAFLLLYAFLQFIIPGGFAHGS